MHELFGTIEKLKDTDANIFILGENGTGKDLIAHLLYANSPRAGKSFVHIDLGSIPEQLFESELFGYTKGAFTDAKKEKQGRFEMASGGTLFLDEIGNLLPAMQSKLLTVIEKKQIIRLGAQLLSPLMYGLSVQRMPTFTTWLRRGTSDKTFCIASTPSNYIFRRSASGETTSYS
jgi:Response regulator containing CheY-like receiver, AAA-type ATPase, and DNA-binding domains